MPFLPSALATEFAVAPVPTEVAVAVVDVPVVDVAVVDVAVVDVAVVDVAVVDVAVVDVAGLAPFAAPLSGALGGGTLSGFLAESGVELELFASVAALL